MEHDLLTISELIAYISASAAAILYIIDTLYSMCKKKKYTARKEGVNRLTGNTDEV